MDADYFRFANLRRGECIVELTLQREGPEVRFDVTNSMNDVTADEIEREFQSLQDYLARIEGDSIAIGLSPEYDSQSDVVIEYANAEVRNWWMILRNVNRLTAVSALRERVASMPGTVAVQVLEISSAEIRIGITTAGTITRQQIEFAAVACGDVEEVEIVLRIPGLAR